MTSLHLAPFPVVQQYSMPNPSSHARTSSPASVESASALFYQESTLLLDTPLDHWTFSRTDGFYTQFRYNETTRQDFAHHHTVRVSWTWPSSNRRRTEKNPPSTAQKMSGTLHNVFHALAGKVIVPAATPCFMKTSQTALDLLRTQIPHTLDPFWKCKRICIQLNNGPAIDAVIVGKVGTLDNRRWLLGSLGSGDFYEQSLSNLTGSLFQMLVHLNSNAIMFNYPGVGASTGMPNRRAMTKAYRALLHFLEDSVKGPGAKEIIGFSFSIGAAIQSYVLKTWRLKKEISYVFVKDRTFSSLSAVASTLLNSPRVGCLVQLTGWDINCVTSSLVLEAPEIIIQTADVTRDTEIDINAPVQIRNDGVIAAKDSLAKALLDNKEYFSGEKVFIGTKRKHNERPADEDIALLANKIKLMLLSNKLRYSDRDS